MDENDVIDLVCARLVSQGYEITQRLTTVERGVDVIARNRTNEHRYFVEAKGGTSSREGSNRFGNPYTQSQVFDRVAKGVFTCLELRAKHPDRERNHILLALPDARWFRSYMTAVIAQLRDAGIDVWFIAPA